MEAIKDRERSNIGKQALLLIFLGASFSLGLGVVVFQTFPLVFLPPWLSLRFDGSIAIVLSSLTLLAVIYGSVTTRVIAAGSLLLFGIANFAMNTLSWPGGSWFSEEPRLGNLPALLCVLLAIAAIFDHSPRWSRWLWCASGALVGVASLAVMIGKWMGLQSGTQLTLLGLAYCLLLVPVVLVLASNRSRPIAALSRAALVAGVFGGVISMSWWFLGSWLYQQERIHDARLLLEQARNALDSMVFRHEQLIRRQAMRRQLVSAGANTALWQRDVDSYFRDTPSLIALVLVPENASDWQIEGARDEAAVAAWKMLAASPEVQYWLRQNSDSHRPVDWAIFEAIMPRTVLLRVADNFEAEEVFLAAFSIDTLLRDALAATGGGESLVVTLAGRPARAAVGSGGLTATETAIASGSTTLGSSLQLQISVIPPSPSLLAPGNLLPLLGGIVGLLLTHYLIVSRALLRRLNERGRDLERSEQRFRSLFYQSPDAVFALDSHGRYRKLNKSAQEILGVMEGAVLDVPVWEVINAESSLGSEQQASLELLFRNALAGHSGTAQLAHQREDSATAHFEMTLMPIVVDGRVEGVYGIARNISRRVATEEQLRILYRGLEASSNAILVVDVRSEPASVIYINPAFSAITGFRDEQVLSQPAESLMLALQVGDEGARAVREAVIAGQSLSITLRNVREDGQAFWNQLVLSPVHDSEGALTHYIAILNDISERKQQENRLAYQATHDALTGLANRSLFSDRLHHDSQLAQRNGCRPVVLFIDLDEFKPINDTLGHRVGDEVLLIVARRLEESLRPSDTLARLGGDEFVVLLPDIRRPSEAEDTAARLLALLRRPYSVEGQELYLSASIGMAMLDVGLSDPGRLVQQADLAMYRAKQQGRDTWQWFTPDMDDQISRRVSLRNELQEAMEAGHLQLHYQPLVDTRGRACGIEALVRWHHPDRGPISPAVFIPVAEETGQIIQLSEWVMHRACTDAVRLRAAGLLPGRLAINLSPMQFHRPGFLDTLKKTLHETGLPARHLELELTEGILMRDTQGAIALLEILSDLGVNIVIDDFGTGFSSLSYIRRLPVHKIKIDGSFVAGILESEKDAAVCKAVLALARELRLKVVAECVETDAQHEYLRAHGCSVFQGYLFARPMPLPDLEAWLQSQAQPQ